MDNTEEKLEQERERGKLYTKLAEEESDKTTEELLDEIKQADNLSGLLLEVMTAINIEKKLGRITAYLMRIENCIRNQNL